MSKKHRSMSSNNKNACAWVVILNFCCIGGLTENKFKNRKNQIMKKKQIKLALLAILGLGVIMTAQAQTTYDSDLIVGFTSTSGNDTMYDLGAASSLVNGETWNLDSLISGYSLSTVNWGVIGTTTSGHNSYMTYSSAFGTPPAVDSQGNWSPINTAVKTLYDNFATAGVGKSATVAASSANSWNVETINPTVGADYINENAGPNVAGETSAPFFIQPDNGSTPTNLGSFSLSANGVLTFNTVAAIPPAPQIVSIVRAGSASTIYFTTTNGSFTYTLYYTNSSGLTASVANWPSSPTTLIGNGSTNSLTDTTTTTNRFYRIGVN